MQIFPNDTNAVPRAILYWHTSHQTATFVGGPVSAANATNEKTKEFFFSDVFMFFTGQNLKINKHRNLLLTEESGEESFCAG